jgi:hypothetical protein
MSDRGRSRLLLACEGSRWISATFRIKEEGVPVGRATQAQASRDRARDARLEAARERRMRLDPEQLAREQRIDEAVVDVEVAWEARSEAEQAVVAAEVEAATALERLLDEKLAVKDVVRLTGMDQATVRRLRQLKQTEPTSVPEAGDRPASAAEVA